MTDSRSAGIVKIMARANLDPDYTAAREDPPPDGRSRQEGPLLRNLRLAVETPGETWRIATYVGRKTADTVASELRRGKRPVPSGTTHDQWSFTVRTVGDRFGIWATFEGPSNDASASA